MTYNVFSGTLNPTHSLTHLVISNYSWFSADECTSCRQQSHAGSKTLLQQNTPVLKLGCRLTQVDLHDGRRMVVVNAYLEYTVILLPMLNLHVDMKNFGEGDSLVVGLYVRIFT